jgi:hypothetical protein
VFASEAEAMLMVLTAMATQARFAIVLARKDRGDMYYHHSHKKANDKYIVASEGIECLGMLSLHYPQTDVKERKSLTNHRMVTKF